MSLQATTCMCIAAPPTRHASMYGVAGAWLDRQAVQASEQAAAAVGAHYGSGAMLFPGMGRMLVLSITHTWASNLRTLVPVPHARLMRTGCYVAYQMLQPAAVSGSPGRENHTRAVVAYCGML
jgi:hypothetical protein